MKRVASLALAAALALSAGALAATPAPSKKKKSTPRPAATAKPSPTPAATPAPEPAAPASTPKPERAPNATLDPADLADFSKQPERVQQLITAALALTKLDLTYTYGSADPAKGGMDCSGTIYRLLSDFGFKEVPRDSPGQYVWVRKAGSFQAVVSSSAESFEFADLRPGDLLFWSGTYSVEREIPVTHVMLYLGIEKKRKQRVMFGASDGRSYAGVQRWGVSVFDFKMPRPTAEKPARFLGYGKIPGL